MWREFKKFVMRGNVFDMAVGIIVGAAFGKIVSSLVKDIIMPPVGLLLGGVDFTNLFLDLSGKGYETLAAAQEAGAATINYGVFLNTIINFLIVAFVIFILVRQAQQLKTKEELTPVAKPAVKECSYGYTQIPIRATRCPHCTSEVE